MPIASAVIDGNKLRIKAPLYLASRIATIPGAKWDKKTGDWALPATAAAAIAMKEAIPSIEGGEQFNMLASSHDEAATFKTAEDLPNIPLIKTSAWRHQRQAYYFIDRLLTDSGGAGALFMDMGTGKSLVAAALAVNKGFQATVVLCPKSVIPAWLKQFNTHLPDRVEVLLLDKHSVAKKAAMIEAGLAMAKALNKPFVVVCNHEAAWREPVASLLLKKGLFDGAIVDESHKGKAPGGKFSLFLSKLGDRVRFRIILTGTPMPHSPLDIYAQYRFLDKSIFGTSFIAFRNRYCVMGGFENKEVVSYKNQEEMNRKIYSIAFRVGKEVLDLPPVMHEDREFDLCPAAMRVYREVEEQFYSEFGDSKVTTENMLTQLLRLRQVTSGHIKDDDGTVHTIDTGKRDLLADLLEDLPRDEPVVVFAVFHHDLDAIREATLKSGRTYAELSARHNDLAAWQNGKLDVIGVQIQSGGVGIDLTRACYCVYFSIGFSLGEYDQSLSRCHRPGQTRTTHFYHLLAAGTVDRHVYDALQTRSDLIQAVLDEQPKGR